MSELGDYRLDLLRKQRLHGCSWYWRCCTDRNLHRSEFYYRKINGVGRFYCGACDRLNTDMDNRNRVA